MVIGFHAHTIIEIANQNKHSTLKFWKVEGPRAALAAGLRSFNPKMNLLRGSEVNVKTNESERTRADPQRSRWDEQTYTSTFHKQVAALKEHARDEPAEKC